MKENRVDLWDNIKFFLMVSVVIGHTIYNFVGSSDIAKGLYLFIYTFHMPAFIFVAGIFSKRAIKEKKLEKVLEYIIIYVFMKYLDSIGVYLLNGKIKFHLFWEDGPGWFALAMAVFLLVTMCIQNIEGKYVLVCAFFLGCVAGLDNHLGDHFVSMRICTFYPVFLAGYYSCEEVQKMERIGVYSTILKVCSFIVINVCLLLSVQKVDVIYPFIKLLKGKFTYEEMGMGMMGVFARLICYGLWALMIIAIILVNSRKHHIYTWLGTRTLSIFIWHNLIIVLLFKVGHLKNILKIYVPHYYLIVSICIAVIISILTAYFPGIKIGLKKKNIEITQMGSDLKEKTKDEELGFSEWKNQ